MKASDDGMNYIGGIMLWYVKTNEMIMYNENTNNVLVLIFVLVIVLD